MAVAALCVLGSLAALFLAPDTVVVHLAGWGLATFLTVALTGAFRLHSSRRHSEGGRYDLGAAQTLERWCSILLVAGLLVGGIHVWLLATELAKR